MLPWTSSQAVLPGMRERRGGWIVNVSSGAARSRDGPPFATGFTGPTITSYGASKAALNRLTNDWGPSCTARASGSTRSNPVRRCAREGADALVGDR